MTIEQRVQEELRRVFCILDPYGPRAFEELARQVQRKISQLDTDKQTKMKGDEQSASED